MRDDVRRADAKIIRNFHSIEGAAYFLKNQNTSVSTMLTRMLVVIGK
jgi:hypothetical protein